MPTREHQVSYRNGSQVMVAGLKLRDIGYCRGASVTVSDPAGVSANAAWRFVVSNDEHATLVSKNPEPPEWIQPGVRIRIDVREAETVATTPRPKDLSGLQPLSANALAEWRRSLIQIINRIEGPKQAVPNEGLASRIGRLSRAGHIPREVAQFMRTVTEMRNETEYRAKVLTPTESEAVAAAWRAVTEWIQNRHPDTKTP